MAHPDVRPFIGFVYCIKNIKNGKVYVGVTTQAIRVRWQRHLALARRGGGSAIHCALRKYGAESFSIAELERCSSQPLLFVAEQRWILELRSFGGRRGYNRTLGGEGLLGFDFPDSARAKMGEKSRARWATPEFRASNVASATEALNQPSCKARISDNSTRKWAETEYREKTVAGLIRGHQTPEYREATRRRTADQMSDPVVRAKVAKGVKECWADPIRSERMRAAFTKNVQCPVSRAKRAAKAKERFSSPEAREILAERSRQLWQDPAYREKMAAWRQRRAETA